MMTQEEMAAKISALENREFAISKGTVLLLAKILERGNGKKPTNLNRVSGEDDQDKRSNSSK